MAYDNQNLIPVLRPKLCGSEAIIPYMQQIDANRWYGNYGPLVQAFEARVANIFAAPASQVVMLANGTLALTVALQALEIPRGSLCLMPSWTFTATPAAALAAGLNPVFMDVDRDTQIITPALVREALKSLKKPVGVVMPVSAFGAPLDVEAWDRFTEETGIPVVIDAAAAYDSFVSGTMAIGRTPVMVSLHTTKICGIGEGGLLLSSSADTIFRIRKIINFGFENDRLSHRMAINAKPSEYNAAIGMAMLDNWDANRAAWARVQSYYIDALAKEGIQCWMDKNYVTTTCNILVPDKAVAFAKALRAHGIDTRRWWETGCHVQPAYRALPIAGELTSTQYLGQTMLGLPGALDLTEETLRYICDEVIALAHSEPHNSSVSFA